MSKSQLQTNNTRLASLIDELKGKASGSSGNVETCTVTFWTGGKETIASGKTAYAYVNYSTFINGLFKSERIEVDAYQTVLLENVVIGSEILIIWKSNMPAEHPDYTNVPWSDNNNGLALGGDYYMTAFLVKGAGTIGVDTD